MTVSLRLLGPGSWRGEPITSSRSRVLLALLAGAPGGLSTERLVGDMWPSETPANPAKAVQVLVSRARSALGSDAIERTATGYRLAIPADEVDVRYAARLARESAAALPRGDAPAALAAATEGLALWDAGPADPDVVDALDGTSLDLADTSRSLRRTRALALAALGRQAEALPELRGALDETPADDVVRAALLRAQAAVVGRASALELFEAHRRDLRDRLGLAPSPVLAAVQAELLEEDAPVRHGIRHAPNRLLGREADLAALRAMIAASRVTSIVGPGGLGKTRLAQELAATADQPVVHVVELAGVATGEGVVPEVAGVFGTRDTSTRIGPSATRMVSDVRATMAEQLSAAPTLLVLDNCEHVVDAVASLVDELVATSPLLRVLTTSRTPLDIDAEAVYLLPQLDSRTASALFVERARAIRPGVELPADVVARVCAQLDGLPLAIELAAAKVRVMSVGEVERRLDNRLALLRGTSRSAPERHQTLLAVIDWSWNLLTDHERAALRRLAVFQDGFTLEAAVVVVGGDEAVAGRGAPGTRGSGRDGDGEALVESLVTQSLLGVSDTEQGARYRMLETVREFAHLQLVDAGDDDDAYASLLRWARRYATSLVARFLGAQQPSALALARAEEGNLVAALRRAAETGDGDTAAATFAVLSMLWSIESNHVRVVRVAPLVERLFYRHDPAPGAEEVFRVALAILAINAAFLRPRSAARALSRLRRLGPGPAGHFATVIAEVIDLVVLHPDTDADEVAAIGERHGPVGRAFAGAAAAMLAENSGRLEEAMALAETALAAAEELGDVWSVAGAHQRVAEMAMERSEYRLADEHAVAAIEGLQRLGAGSDVVQLRGLRALVALHEGRVADADRLLATAASGVPERAQVADFPLEVSTDTLRAEILLAQGRVAEGLAVYRAASTPGPANQVPLDLGNNWAGLEPWFLFASAAALAAHVLHDARAEGTALVADLAARTATLLGRPPDRFIDYPVTGSLLFALGLWAVTAPDGPGRDEAGRRAAGGRLMALATAFGHSRSTPSLSPDPGRAVALEHIGAAYDEWLSTYAALDRSRQRELAQDLLAEAVGDL